MFESDWELRLLVEATGSKIFKKKKKEETRWYFGRNPISRGKGKNWLLWVYTFNMIFFWGEQFWRNRWKPWVERIKKLNDRSKETDKRVNYLN